MIDGTNLYLYVRANPVTFLNPLGLSCFFGNSIGGEFCNGALDGAMQTFDVIVYPVFEDCYDGNDPGMALGKEAAMVADAALPTGKGKAACKGLINAAKHGGDYLDRLRGCQECD